MAIAKSGENLKGVLTRAFMKFKGDVADDFIFERMGGASVQPLIVRFDSAAMKALDGVLKGESGLTSDVAGQLKDVRAAIQAFDGLERNAQIDPAVASLKAAIEALPDDIIVVVSSARAAVAVAVDDDLCN